MQNPKSFQEIILTLQNFWAQNGCSILQPYDFPVGAGNDTINMGANLTALDTVDGGEGTDTLITSAAVANVTILGGMSNIETIK